MLSSLPPVESAVDPGLWGGAAHLQGRFSHLSEPSLETSSQAGMSGTCH